MKVYLMVMIFFLYMALKCGIPKNRFIQPQLDDKLFIHFGKFNYRIISIKKKYPFFHHHHRPYIYIVSAMPCRLLHRQKNYFLKWDSIISINIKYYLHFFLPNAMHFICFVTYTKHDTTHQTHKKWSESRHQHLFFTTKRIFYITW